VTTQTTGVESGPPRSRAAALRFPGFDGLRAIAACSVVVFHLSNRDLRPVAHDYGRYLTMMNFGVPLFFVISGFLLYRPFVAATFAGTARPATREFLRRRVLRVVPGFWVALTVLCILFNFNASGGRSWKWAIVNYGLLQSFVDTAAPPGLGLAWTIGTEMTFYLALPLYAALLARGNRPAERQLHREMAGLAALVLVSVAWRLLFIVWTLPPSLRWYGSHSSEYLPANTDYFAGGMLLAVVSAWFAMRGEPRWARWRGLPAITWAAAFASYALCVEVVAKSVNGSADSDASRFIRHELFLLLVVALAMPAAFGERGRGAVRRVIESRALQLVGLVSFGIYLYHQAMIRLVYEIAGVEDTPFGVTFPHGPDYPFAGLLLLVALATALCATASYVVVEAPFLRRKHRNRAPSDRVK
jgi:peptidoglycan/LPS O-acetylase OafA/YrhL